jgi:sulfotransferase
MCIRDRTNTTKKIIMKQFIMLSGLPRSGSTVLTSLLNQHPDIHATTTSPIVDLIASMEQDWNVLSQAYLKQYHSQFANMVHGMIQGAYYHIDRNIIIDKNRLWPRYINLMKSVLKKNPKFILTVRDVPSILASYILLIQKNSDQRTFIDQDLIDLNLPINNKNRCKIIWEKYCNGPYNSLKIAFNSKNIEICLVYYDDIINDPQKILNRISDFIGIRKYEYNINQLQPMNENDDYHGGIKGLHEIRPRLEKTSPHPREVLGKELFDLYTNMRLDFWNDN